METTATDNENSIYISCHIRESKSGNNSGRHSLLPLRQASYPAYLSAKIQQRNTTKIAVEIYENAVKNILGKLR